MIKITTSSIEHLNPPVRPHQWRTNNWTTCSIVGFAASPARRGDIISHPSIVTTPEPHPNSVPPAGPAGRRTRCGWLRGIGCCSAVLASFLFPSPRRPPSSLLLAACAGSQDFLTASTRRRRRAWRFRCRVLGTAGGGQVPGAAGGAEDHPAASARALGVGVSSGSGSIKLISLLLLYKHFTYSSNTPNAGPPRATQCSSSPR